MLSKSFLIILFCTLSCCFVKAQTTDVRGVLTDSVGTPLPNATIVLLKAADSVMHSFTISDSQGRFSLQKAKAGAYILQISYLGYANLSLSINIEPGKEALDLGKISLKSSSERLKEIAITDERIPIVIKKDTIEYTADAFKTQANANVESLLKKLPGVEVERDGTIKAQGREVEKILVDGKEFFGDDPQIASKNLPADAIDKVQVFDQLSEMSQFTGIDDGEREKTINLTLKEDRKKGYFGNMEAGYGNEQRHAGKFNLNRFNKTSQLSLIGATNNTNTQNFSLRDFINFSGGLNALANGGGMIQLNDEIAAASLDNNIGIRKIWSLGTNLSFTPNNQVDLQMSYFYNGLQNDLQSNTTRQNFMGEDFFLNHIDQNTLNNYQNHRLNTRLKYKINKKQDLTFRIQSTLNDQDVDANQFSQISDSEDLLENQTEVQNNQDAFGLSLTSSLMYRLKLNKPGRSFVAQAQVNLNDKQRDDRLNSTYEVFGQDSSTIELTNQFQDQNDDQSGFDLRFTFTEPLGKQNFLQFNYRYDQLGRNAQKDFFDIPEVGEPVLNDELSTNFSSDFTFSHGGLKFFRQRQKSKLSFGFDLQSSQLEGLVENPEFGIKRDFFNVLPNFRWDYAINSGQNLSLDYRTAINVPSLEQLQPIINNTNPQIIYEGNPNLQTEYVHNTRVNYTLFDQFSFTQLFVMMHARYTHNKINNSSTIDESFRQIITPEHVDYDIWLTAYTSFGMPIKPLGIKFNIDGNLIFNQSILKINAVENTVKRWINEIDLKFENRKKQWADVAFGVKLDLNFTTYSKNNTQNQQFQMTTLYTDWNLDFLKRWNFNTFFAHEIYAGDAFTNNQSISRWQASISKTFLKYDRGQLKITVFDILNQNRGIRRNSSFNFVEDQQANALGRYFLVSFVYAIRKIGGKGKKKG